MVMTNSSTILSLARQKFQQEKRLFVLTNQLKLMVKLYFISQLASLIGPLSNLESTSYSINTSRLSLNYLHLISTCQNTSTAISSALRVIMGENQIILIQRPSQELLTSCLTKSCWFESRSLILKRFTSA